MFSLARRYGAATIQGCPYRYFEDGDMLVRVDVIDFVRRFRRAAAAAEKMAAKETAKARQGELL